jgi:pimeloyl-ACP methyl ester carboxylesterase
VVGAIGDRRHLVVVGHSYGGFTAPLVADRVPVDLLVLVAGMIPVRGEAPADWWDNTGYAQAVREQARRDGGPTGNDDPFVAVYHTEDRLFLPDFLRRLVTERLGITPDEIAAGHCVALSRPRELVDLARRLLATQARP